jgi:hypothetical protein
MDLLRQLLLLIEDKADGLDNEIDIEISGVGPQVVAEHLRLLVEARLIDGLIVPDGSELFDHVEPTRLTWTGHDFLDNIRDPEIWKRAKAGAVAARGLSFELLGDIAKGFIRKQVEAKTGITL